MRHIPNFITSLNLTSGFVAIIFAANGDIRTASWLILAAMIFDFMDGFSARALNAYSALGKELDSLADIVSFGVAPALIIYQLLNGSILLFTPILTDHAGIKTAIILFIPAIMPVCGALRLAKFNIDTTQTTSFKGLPIPANALAVISFVIAGHYSHSTFYTSLTASPVLLSVFTIVVSLLMVTRIPLLSLKISSLNLKGNEGRYILFGLILVSFAILGIGAAPLIVPLYIIVSLFSGFF